MKSKKRVNKWDWVKIDVISGGQKQWAFDEKTQYKLFMRKLKWYMALYMAQENIIRGTKEGYYLLKSNKTLLLWLMKLGWSWHESMTPIWYTLNV